jgi:hypothetical protein
VNVESISERANMAVTMRKNTAQKRVQAAIENAVNVDR